MHVVDIWESQEDFQKFSEDLLLPTMRKVLEERGISMDGPPPEPTFEEAFDRPERRSLTKPQLSTASYCGRNTSGSNCRDSSTARALC